MAAQSPYEVVRAAMDHARGMSVTPINPNMTVTPIHGGMTVTHINGIRGFRGLGLDSGIQNGLVIVGALAFAFFALTIMGISKSVEKREKGK